MVNQHSAQLLMSLPLSILDLATICEGDVAADAFRNSLALAQLADSLGLQRYWLAEHHGIPSVASSATAVVIGHVHMDDPHSGHVVSW